MTSYDWTTIRTDAIRRFQDEPSPKLETEILDVFRATPARVVTAINQIATDYANGKIRSPWGALRARLQRGGTAGDSIIATDLHDRETAIAKAERWIRNAGLHYDLKREVDDDLFGDTGSLRDWADDELLHSRMLTLWREHRPRGEKTEAEADQRITEHKQWLARWKAIQDEHKAKLDQIQRDHEAEARRRAQELRKPPDEPTDDPQPAT